MDDVIKINKIPKEIFINANLVVNLLLVPVCFIWNSLNHKYETHHFNPIFSKYPDNL
jgi:hypothetical protein